MGRGCVGFNNVMPPDERQGPLLGVPREVSNGSGCLVDIDTIPTRQVPTQNSVILQYVSCGDGRGVGNHSQGSKWLCRYNPVR